MTTRPVLSLALGIAAAVVALGAAPVRAEEPLPPERPTTPYRATMRNTFSITEPGGGSSGGDTVEIRVSGARLLEDSQIMEEKSVIVDMETREVIEFDPKAADKVAARFPLSDTPIPYIQGRAGLAAFNASWPAPKIAGTDEVAKQKCTILHYGKPEEDGIAACVSKEGVVLRAKLEFPDYEREFEALDFDAGKQDEKWFRPPEGFTVVEGAGPENAEPTE
jgi:hypothetical protein